MVTVITGNAGSGKTMLANTLALTAPVVDLDVCGTTLDGAWHVPPTLVEAAYAQGYRIFAGVPDIVQHLWMIPHISKDGGVVLQLDRSNPDAMKERDEWNRAHDPELADKWKDRLHNIPVEYANPVPDSWIIKEVITTQVGRAPKGRKGGRAVDSDVRSWCLAFPTPSALFVGWTPEGAPKEVNEIVREYFDWVHDHRGQIVHLASKREPVQSTPAPTGTLWRLVPGYEALVRKAKRTMGGNSKK